MVPIQALRWYRYKRCGGTDTSAMMVPFRRYYHVRGHAPFYLYGRGNEGIPLYIGPRPYAMIYSSYRA